MELNKLNYHSLEANKEYMSNSQYADFMECESMAMAKIKGEFVEEPSVPLTLGNYVHAWAEGELENFKAENPELFSSKGPTKGQLKSAYAIGDDMIKTLENDPFCMYALEGDKEVIFTAEFAGAPWKIKIDAYRPEKLRFSDLKTVKSVRDKYWKPGIGWCSFVEAYEYIRQFAIYGEIERLSTGRDVPLDPFIVAVSKEDPPDKEVINIDQNILLYELELVAENMPRILEVKRGKAEPKRCEKCKHCRQTKQIKRVVHYTDLIDQGA
jgi:hypothetical protein